MKTIFFTIAILFSFSAVSAQEVDTKKTATTGSPSKTVSNKTLQKVSDLEINMKESKKEVANNSKKDFYDLLLKKSGFHTDIKKTTRLTNNMTKIENTSPTKNNQVVNLVS